MHGSYIISLQKDACGSYRDVGPELAELVGTGEASGAGADDDDVRLCVPVHVFEVAGGHGARDLWASNRRARRGSEQTQEEVVKFLMSSRS
jgi:hypothetical protein